MNDPDEELNEIAERIKFLNLSEIEQEYDWLFDEYEDAKLLFNELALRLALKDTDLLLERDRAEKAEKELGEAQKLHELDERIICVSADAAKLQNNKLEKAEQQLSEANICEQCDGNTEGVHFCAACWNRLATQMLRAQNELKELKEKKHE